MLTQDDPESKRNQYERDYEKYAAESMQATVTQPKFKFYLYNEEGDLVQEQLSIHDIQHFLLHTAYNTNNKNNIFGKWDGSENVSLHGEDNEESNNNLGILLHYKVYTKLQLYNTLLSKIAKDKHVLLSCKHNIS